MLVTTTPTIEGGRITRYYGIVSGESVPMYSAISLPASATWWVGEVALMKKCCAKLKI